MNNGAPNSPLWKPLLDWLDDGSRAIGIPSALSYWLFFSLPAFLAYAYLLSARGEDILLTDLELGAVALALSWSWVGAISVRYYRFVLMPAFNESVAQLVQDETLYPAISGGGGVRFGWLVRWSWVAITFAAFVSVEPFLSEYFGFRGFGDPMLWLAAVGVLSLGSLSAEGFVLVFNTFGLVRRLAAHELRLDPYAFDGVGGLDGVGRLTIGTTTLFSTGAFFVPGLVSVASASDGVSIVYIYALILLFAAMVLASFIYPNWIIYRVAKKARDSDLRDVGRVLNACSDDLVNGECDSLSLQRFEMLQGHFRAMRETNLYPFGVGMFARLASSVLLPVVLAVLQRYLSILVGD
jgi:hypothetical protein